MRCESCGSIERRTSSSSEAAVRWVGRFALEAKAVTLEDVQSALSALQGIAMGVPTALDELARLCTACGITRI